MVLDQTKLKGVHPDLVKVLVRAAAITDVPFKVTEGLRTVARQKQLVASGMSQTMNSRHLTGHAVDIVPVVDLNKDGKVSTDEMYSWPLYYKLAKVMKQAAKDVGVAVEWGGDWKSFKDGPHWQLPFSKYPKVQSFGDFVDNAPQATNETEKSVIVKSLGVVTAGITAAGSLSGELIGKLIDLLNEQQANLTSGDYVKASIGLVVVLGSLYMAYKKLKATS